MASSPKLAQLALLKTIQAYTILPNDPSDELIRTRLEQTISILFNSFRTVNGTVIKMNRDKEIIKDFVERVFSS